MGFQTNPEKQSETMFLNPLVTTQPLLPAPVPGASHA